MNRFCLLSLSGAHKQTTMHKQTTVPQTKEARKIRQKKHQRTTNKKEAQENIWQKRTMNKKYAQKKNNQKQLNSGVIHGGL